MNIKKLIHPKKIITLIRYLILLSFLLITHDLTADETSAEVQGDKRLSAILFQSPLAYDPSGVYPHTFNNAPYYDGNAFYRAPVTAPPGGLYLAPSSNQSQPSVQANQEDFYTTCQPEIYAPSTENIITLFVPSVHLRGGDGRSYCTGYESIEGFLTYFNKDTGNSFFVDLAFLRLGEGRLAVNSLIGVRGFAFEHKKIIGAYIGYDYRRHKGGNLSQFALGAELLGECWDLRVNGYIPIKNKTVFLDSTLFTYSGGYFALRDRYDSAMWGLDVEFGKMLFNCKCFNLYAAIGPYFYNSRGCCGSLLGGMGRLTTCFCDRLYVDFYITYDHLFDLKTQGEISFYLPFSSVCDWWRCIFQPIYRNRVILVDETCCWTTNF